MQKNKEINIKATVTLEHITNSSERVQQHIGGTRSGKTYSILIYLILRAIQEKLQITVVRKTIPVLKRTIIKDFRDILKDMEMWNEDQWKEVDKQWVYGDSVIQFISTDSADKLRGIASDILFIDEASEIDEESYFQLSIRTSKQIILAYNPTVSPYHWLRKMKDCDRFVTTYMDNPFIPQSMVEAIEDLQWKNQKKWTIYGKGEFAMNDKAIYKMTLIDKIQDAELVGYGMDFGFSTDPTAMVAVFRNGNRIYLKQMLYEVGLTSNEIIKKLQQLQIGKEEIWADSSDPRLIEEIYRGGYNIKPAKKGPDSIRFGIQTLQNYEIYVEKGSQDLINEIYSYSYATDKNGHITDTPEDGFDHLMDAARYLALMRLTAKSAAVGNYGVIIPKRR